MKQMRANTPDGRLHGAVAESFIAPNSRLTAFERLEIYNRQYWFRVLGALAEDFPGTAGGGGRAALSALSVAYLSGASQPLVHAAQSWFEASRVACRASAIMRAAVIASPWMWRASSGLLSKRSTAAERAPLTLDQIATLDGDSRLALAAASAAHRAGLSGRRSGSRPAQPGEAPDQRSRHGARRGESACQAAAAARAGPPGLPRIAWIFRFTTAGSSGRSFKRSRRFARACRWPRRLRPDLRTSRIAVGATAQRVSASGLPTGPSWAGSALRNLNPLL